MWRHVDKLGRQCLGEEDRLLRASVFQYLKWSTCKGSFLFYCGTDFFIFLAYILNSDIPCSISISFAKVTFSGGLQLKRQGALTKVFSGRTRGLPKVLLSFSI